MTQHTAYLCLVFQILSNFSSREIPDLDEAIHTPRNQILAIRGESSTFWMTLGSELKMPIPMRSTKVLTEHYEYQLTFMCLDS